MRDMGIIAWMRLAQVYQRVQRDEAALLGRHHLTIAQFDVLARLTLHDGIPQQALADQLLVTKGNVCGLIDRMSAQGLVERHAHPTDKRSHLLYLTPAGKQLATMIIPIHDAMITRRMGSLSSDESQHLAKLLRRLVQATST